MSLTDDKTRCGKTASMPELMEEKEERSSLPPEYQKTNGTKRMRPGKQMKEIRRIPEEAAEELRKNRYVESADGHLVILTLEFHRALYDRWKESPASRTVMEAMKENGIDPDVLGHGYVEALVWDFQTYGDPLALPARGTAGPHQPAERRNDVVLLSTGILYATRRGLQWEKEFRKELRSRYPEVTIEYCLVQAGIDPQLVGKARIKSLRHHLREDEIRRQRARTGCKSPDQKKETEKAARKDKAYRYFSNPYVEEVTSRFRLCMKDEFYNEVYYLKDLPVEEILRMYGIDSKDLSAACVARIRVKKETWRLTDARCSDWTDSVCRIQAARLSALVRCTEEAFAKIRGAVKGLSPAKKKELCRMIAEYPARPGCPYGYSRRYILEKAGIPKSVYYRALNDSRYGLAEERRKEKDRQDLEKLIKVMKYKGFEKGIRQVYMMMPDLTGETFALSRIRRLLRRAGIRTKVRCENPARQHMTKFINRNRKPDLLKRKFRLHRPNEVRLTDVTYLEYGKDGDKKRAYGSSCIDPVTGKLLVFHISGNNDLELALRTLEKLSEHPAVENALFHSDQGTLYFTDEFQEKVEGMGMVQSMSKRGNCWDNAPQESFFGHFKDECCYGGCESLDELQAMADEYAWYYNNERRQWGRKRMTPVQYEEYLLSLDEEEFAAYMKPEQEKYDRMKAKAEKQAAERAKTLGV